MPSAAPAELSPLLPNNGLIEASYAGRKVPLPAATRFLVLEK